jgi:hypothetical protein
MDILTHGILGAATACIVAKKAETRLASTVGFVAGIIPDDDFDKPLEFITNRTFTREMRDEFINMLLGK